MSTGDIDESQRRAIAAASASIVELALAGDSLLTASDIAAWANVIKEELGLSLQQVADEINALGGNPGICEEHVGRALEGDTAYLGKLLQWLESKCANDPLTFERDDRGEPVWRIKIAYDR